MSNPAPDPRDHAKFRKLEEAIQRALAQEMFRNKICGCQYKREVVRHVVDGSSGSPGVAKMR